MGPPLRAGEQTGGSWLFPLHGPPGPTQSMACCFNHSFPQTPHSQGPSPFLRCPPTEPPARTALTMTWPGLQARPHEWKQPRGHGCHCLWPAPCPRAPRSLPDLSAPAPLLPLGITPPFHQNPPPRIPSSCNDTPGPLTHCRCLPIPDETGPQQTLSSHQTFSRLWG